MATVRGALARAVLPFPARARHMEYSVVASADDQPGPSDRLLDVTIAAAQRARGLDLQWVADRMDGPPYWPLIWPGEHYRFLAAIASVLQAQTIIEIGTATGLSALALLAGQPEGGTVTTFDLFPWDRDASTHLRPGDLEDGRLRQVVDDVSTPEGTARHAELLKRADLIFIDAAKDGAQEQRFLERFEAVGLDAEPIVVFDDIRQWKMVATWRAVRRPKLDATSFGHWTGTGLIDFAQPPC